MGKAISSFKREMAGTGIVTLKDACEVILEMLEEMRVLEDGRVKAKNSILQLSSEIERLKGPGV